MLWQDKTRVLYHFIFMVWHLFAHLGAFLKKLFDILIQIFHNLQNFLRSWITKFTTFSMSKYQTYPLWFKSVLLIYFQSWVTFFYGSLSRLNAWWVVNCRKWLTVGWLRVCMSRCKKNMLSSTFFLQYDIFLCHVRPKKLLG